MWNTPFDALVYGINPQEQVLDDHTIARWDEFQFYLTPAVVEGSLLNPLQALALAVMDGQTLCNLENDDLFRLTGLDRDFMLVGDTLDDLTDDEILRALGRMALGMLAAWRNQVREHLLDGVHEGMEALPSAACDFFARRALRQMAG